MAILESFRLYLKARQISVQSEVNEQRLSFQHGGLNFVFISDPRDPSYFRIILPRIDHIENADVVFFDLLNDLTRTYKTGKAIFVNDDVWLSFEQFVDDADAYHDAIFERGFSILSDMLIEYRRRRASVLNDNQKASGQGLPE